MGWVALSDHCSRIIRFFLHINIFQKIQPSINTTKFSIAVSTKITCLPFLKFFLPQTHCKKYILHCNPVHKYRECRCAHTHTQRNKIFKKQCLDLLHVIHFVASFFILFQFLLKILIMAH